MAQRLSALRLDQVLSPTLKELAIKIGVVSVFRYRAGVVPWIKTELGQIFKSAITCSSRQSRSLAHPGKVEGLVVSSPWPHRSDPLITAPDVDSLGGEAGCRELSSEMDEQWPREELFKSMQSVRSVANLDNHMRYP